MRVRILAISGSLRRVSSNTSLIQALAALAPADVTVEIYEELALLPPFNPDVERDGLPAIVARLEGAVRLADAVLISSPEYAHGAPGVLKNALDWLVGSNELTGKPVALLNASARASHAWTSLAETLTTMAARVVQDASITVSLDGRRLDAKGIAADPNLAAALGRILEAIRLATIG
jgi:NAD(P)H-dependent FMN reductase